MSERQLELTDWLKTISPNSTKKLQALTGDASFRRYYRWSDDKESRIVMDAPPPKESIEPFLSITVFLREHGIRSPEVFYSEAKQGFLVLEDFGDNHFIDWLKQNAIQNAPYQKAIQIIKRMQSIPKSSTEALGIPAYSRQKLLEEMQLFPEWMLEKRLQYSLCKSQRDELNKNLDWIVQSVVMQPSAFVHRDYHARNIMITHREELGVLDYQDAAWGPYTYDLVSLLKDCYIRWPEEDVERWALEYYFSSPIANHQAQSDFLNDFHLMGLQRHLKVLGVFCRLSIRDGKHSYLGDLPRVLQYAVLAAKRFPQLDSLYRLLAEIRLS